VAHDPTTASARIERLAEDERGVVERAAVIGKQFLPRCRGEMVAATGAPAWTRTWNAAP